jgi:hypothetical protein
VISVLARSWQRMMISNSSSAPINGSLRIPRSSMSSGTLANSFIFSLRLPSSLASASSPDLSRRTEHLIV